VVGAEWADDIEASVEIVRKNEMIPCDYSLELVCQYNNNNNNHLFILEIVKL